MAFQPVPDTVQIDWLYEIGAGYQWQVSTYYRKAAFDNTALEALAVAVSNAIDSGNIITHLSSSAYYKGVRATDLRTEGAYEYTYPANVVGLEGSQMLSLSMACVVTLRTALRGRSYRGRLYFTGFCEIDQGGGSFSPIIGTSCTDALTSAKVAAEALGWTWVIVSRHHDHVKRASGVTTPVTSSVVRSLIGGSQRRRAKRP